MTEIPHWLEKQYELQPSAVAVETSEDQKITYEELRSQSRMMASGLINRGVSKGDHIAFLADNHFNYAVFIHAVSYVGGIVVCLNTRLTPSELAYQVVDAEADYFVVDHHYAQLGKQTVDSSDLDLQIVSLEALPQTEKNNDLKETINFNDRFTMMYTSGTTGSPKAVIHTYGNHWFSAVASALNLGLSESDKWLVCLPLFHVGGFSLLMKNVIYGMPVVLLEKFDPSKVNRLIVERNISLISVVTVMLQRILEHKKGEYPVSFRGALLGGGPAPEPLLNKAFQFNIPVIQTYGMTETSSQISTLRPQDAWRKLGSAGKALSSASVKIVSDGKECSPYDIGEIHVKGPMVSIGYYHHEPHREDYLSTGDLGYVDQDGFLFVVDRLKDMIITGGENVYPAEIESVLQEVEGIQEAAVTGMKHSEWGEVPAAFVVRKDNWSVTIEELRIYCMTRLAGYKVPVEFYFIEELPRNASNKIVRRNLHSLIDKEGRNGDK
ncbi:o-succinylbenzoate--CoA ligase [Halobacillus sp. A5]|uniref:o-succinylbenzoate--CoA ligase n=1 Tax=Halobacillus sp. A5 TaxID=2880263 RepID=UPI0020A6209B|nr:o-succinylbenzoate--CoA ligase [Halobacillus sp. A5]MCP3028302.1 o-succinylbenzoate--CoA ligase [Halobacillus sp. A5]